MLSSKNPTKISDDLVVNALKEMLGVKDFKVKISSKIGNEALFQKFLYLLFYETFIA